jgi:hypothetical protein
VAGWAESVPSVDVWVSLSPELPGQIVVDERWKVMSRLAGAIVARSATTGLGEIAVSKAVKEVEIGLLRSRPTPRRELKPRASGI